jgi:hypothetical protein
VRHVAEILRKGLLPDVCGWSGKKAVETGWKVDRMPRNCTVCRHPQRQEIEADLQAGLSYRDVARRYNVSKDVICRHRAGHVSVHATPALATVSRIRGLLDSGETATTWHASLLSIQETRRHFEELLRQLNVGIGR